MGGLDGRRAIVVGATGGIGKAIALAFAEGGAALLVTGRDESTLASVARDCRAAGVRTETAVVDISVWTEVESVMAYATSRLGAVDVLVNAAGIVTPIGSLHRSNPAEWADAMHVNLIGVFHLCRAVIPEMIRRRCGKIILLSGGGATGPFPRFSAYAAAKAGVVRLTETLAEEVKEFNVQVNAIAPGFVDSNLQDDVLAAGSDAGLQFLRAKEARESGVGTVQPQLAGELAVFLASEDSGELTGKLISAQHDPWRKWKGHGEELNASPLFTLRRLDPFTLATVAEAPTWQ